MVNSTEGEIVTKKFFEEGYQAFVLTYTTNMFQIMPFEKQPLKDISRAVRHIRSNAKELQVLSDRIACCGFSVGGTSGRQPCGSLWGFCIDGRTLPDELVSVENSVLYAKACRENGVPCELHLFMDGCHGMSLADEDWAKHNTGEGSLYTMLQQWQTMKTLYRQNPASIPEIFTEAAQAEKFTDFVAA